MANHIDDTMKHRPSRDYDPELKIESVTRYVVSASDAKGGAHMVPISVARIKFLEKDDNDKSPAT
jgi:hypothetical protein